MPRTPRLFVVGAAYYFHCRIARRERLFADAAAARAFLDLLTQVKQEQGLTILAWSVMPNHDHLALRAGELPLWRSMRLVQGRFAKVESVARPRPALARAIGGAHHRERELPHAGECLCPPQPGRESYRRRPGAVRVEWPSRAAWAVRGAALRC